MEINGEDSSIWQSNTTSYSAQMDAMLQDDAMAEFPPLTPPPKVSRGARGPKPKKSRKKKAAPPDTESDSEEGISQSHQKQAKKKKSKKNQIESTP